MQKNARQIAFDVLVSLNNYPKTIDQAWSSQTRHVELSKPDRALSNELIYGVLRWQAKLDWIIQKFSKFPLKKIDKKILILLRIGLYQIFFLDRIPTSAAVNTAVEMAKKFSKPWTVRFINGILRNIVRHYDTLAFPDQNSDPVLYLSVTKSFPIWLINRWINHYGLEETTALCDYLNQYPATTLRVNTLKTNCSILSQKLLDNNESATRTHFSSIGLKINKPNSSFFSQNTFQDGLFQVQDEGAQLITQLLAPQPGETILDACAGLGTKTGHIGQLMKNHGRIVALDINSKKLISLETQMKNLGVSNVETWHHDLDNPFNHNHFSQFDRILLDAPCSGLGVIQKNPDIKWNILKKNLTRYQQLQLKYLLEIKKLVKVNGIIVFAVCSLEPEENDQVIKSFLKISSNFVIDKNMHPVFTKNSLVNEKGYLLTYPHRFQMDGFFAVRLTRKK